MQGFISAAQPSKSGKNLQIQIAGNWYTSKNWEFQGMVGKEITFESQGQDFTDGGHIEWINEYQEVGVSTTPSAQAFDQRYSEANPPPIGAPLDGGHPDLTTQAQAQRDATITINKEASIIAQALSKTIQHDNAGQAWESYVYLYGQVRKVHP